MLSRFQVSLAFLFLALIIAVMGYMLQPIPQPLSYHNFADQRGGLGIPNFNDVASNLAFAIVGVSGLIVLLGTSHTKF